MGDFNEIIFPEDKFGGFILIYDRFRILLDFKFNINITDILFVGNVFTWRKKNGINNIFERLDRVLVNFD